MTDTEKRIRAIIPNYEDFSAVDIANKIYPHCVRQDSGGRVSNKAIPAVSRTLRKMRGVIEVGYLRFWYSELK